ncbi:hypothetical protein DFH07DRAFT_743908 [Mycena maculata]|uniref:Reverse transcriptase zinc-binding domain-containing protein n=1 Tax=Mycena maculata TaxID=230809 RepID=A0AAD7J398_9AGAR|nr:hypothetical protein DFH07DRAFT_743908 [Mycena maculata]
MREQSQYAAECYAALEAIRTTRSETVLTITSTQSYVRDSMNKKLMGWEHEGWVGIPHREVLRCLAAELKTRKARTIFKIVAPGSHDRELCRQAAQLAKNAARSRTDEQWILKLPLNSALPGLSLQDNCQRVFYRSIREIKTNVQALFPRSSTTKMLGTIKKDMADRFDKHVDDPGIWKSLTSKDFLPCTAQFLWKGIHNAHRIGNYWTHIPECEDHAMCSDCGVTEDLEHILLKCGSPGRDTVWKAAETLWHEKEDNWPELSLGIILGCRLAEFRDENGKLKRGSQRLYQILISEPAYLNWKLQNDRVISRDGTPASEEEIMNKWKYIHH